MWGDPLDDFDRWDAEQERWLSRRPVCRACGEHIQEESAINWDDDWYCEDCQSDFWKAYRAKLIAHPSRSVLCAGCGETIPQEYAVQTDDGWYCEECEDIPRDEAIDYFTEDIGD